MLLLPLTACVETDLTLRADGTVAGTISWNTNAGTTAEQARGLFKATGITVKRAEVNQPDAATKEPGAPVAPRRGTVEIEAVNAEALAAAPLFKALGVKAVAADEADGSRTLTVSASNKARIPPVKPPSDSVIRLHLPGSVAKTSASAAGRDVTWTIPSPDYFGKPSVDLSVTYASSDAAPAAQ
jgi:hypothetical protein